MGVFGDLYTSRFTLGTANSFMEGLRKKLEAELQQQQALEQARQQFGFQKELTALQGDISRQNALFSEFMRLRTELARSGYSSQDLAPLDAAITKLAQGTPLSQEEVQAAIAPAAAGYRAAIDENWLRQNWQDLTQFFSSEEQAKQFEEAAKAGDWQRATSIAIQAKVPFNQVELEQRKAQAGLTGAQLRFYEETEAARIAQEVAKAKGLDLQNEETKQRMELATKRFEMDAERLSWERETRKLTDEEYRLRNELLKLQMEWAIEDRPQERERKALEIQEMRKRITQMDLDAKLKRLQADETERRTAFNYLLELAQFADEDPELAKAYAAKAKDELKKRGIDIGPLDAYIATKERLKKYEDPARSEALKKYELALSTPPPAGTTTEQMTEQINSVIKALEDAGIKNVDVYRDALVRAWTGILNQYEEAQLRLALERQKLDVENNQRANEMWLKILQERRRVYDTASNNTRDQIATVEAKLRAAGCAGNTMDAILLASMASSGGIQPERLPPECDRQEAERLGAELSELLRKQEHINNELLAIAAELGGERTPPPPVAPTSGGVSSVAPQPTTGVGFSTQPLPPDQFAAAVERISSDVIAQASGGKKVPPGYVLALAAQNGLTERQANALVEKMRRDGLVAMFNPDAVTKSLSDVKNAGFSVVTTAYLKMLSDTTGVPYEDVVAMAKQYGLGITDGEGDRKFREWVRKSREENPIVR